MADPTPEQPRVRGRSFWRKCPHLRTRCVHGDEGWARMKVYAFRFWKEPVVRRQVCRDCGTALDRDPICAQHPGRHTWHGAWTDREADHG